MNQQVAAVLRSDFKLYEIACYYRSFTNQKCQQLCNKSRIGELRFLSAYNVLIETSSGAGLNLQQRKSVESIVQMALTTKVPRRYTGPLF